MAIFCPLCKQESPLFFHALDCNRRISNELFDYYRCPSCNLFFLSPIPDELGQYYTAEYYSVPKSLEQLDKAAQQDRYKINIVQQFHSKGRLLEIGPAHGKFSLLAKQAGFEVEALERDGSCCNFLQDVVGIKAINSDNPSEGLRNAERYDVIVLWHVMEHLPNPWATLKTLVEKLLPGGIIVIAAPNPSAVQFRVLGRFWTHLDAPRHLSLIPLLLLQRQTQLLGLKTVWSTTADDGALKLNIIGWQDSFANFASRGFFKKRMRALGRFVSIFTAPIERVNGLGSAYTAVFLKEK